MSWEIVLFGPTGLGLKTSILAKIIHYLKPENKHVAVKDENDMSISINDIRVKVKLLRSENMLAQATVILCDIWEEKGWKILRSNRLHPDFQENLWIQAPSYKTKDGKWQEMVFIDDKRLYAGIQMKIYDAYCMRRNGEKALEPEAKNENVDENVSPEEIFLEKTESNYL